VKKDAVKLVVLIAVVTFIFLPPFAKYQELRAKNKRLEDEIARLKVETKRLEEEKRKLETDITYVEKKAREKIGVVRKGEIVIK
jgi:cell division protein FtsB